MSEIGPRTSHLIQSWPSRPRRQVCARKALADEKFCTRIVYRVAFFVSKKKKDQVKMGGGGLGCTTALFCFFTAREEEKKDRNRDRKMRYFAAFVADVCS